MNISARDQGLSFCLEQNEDVLQGQSEAHLSGRRWIFGCRDKSVVVTSAACTVT